MAWYLYDATGKVIVSQGDFDLTIDADSGTPEVVNNGDTIKFDGGASIGTIVSATNVITVNSIWDYQSVLGGSGSFDIDLTSIAKFDSTVKSIVLEVSLRSAAVATTDSVYILFNNDAVNANYQRQVEGAAGGVAVVAAASDPVIALCTGSTAPANAFTSAQIILSNSQSGQLKSASAINLVGLTATTTIRVDGGGVVWKNTATINRIQIRTDNHPTDLFLTGSYVRLRLIK